MDILNPLLTSNGINLAATTTDAGSATTTTAAQPATTTVTPPTTTTTTTPPSTTTTVPSTTTTPPSTTTSTPPSTTTTTTPVQTTTTSSIPVTSVTSSLTSSSTSSPISSPTSTTSSTHTTSTTIDHVPTSSVPTHTPSFSTSFSLISYTSNNQVVVSTTAIIATITPSPAGEGDGTQVSPGSGPNAAVIGGAVGGVVVFAALVIAAWVLWIRRKKRQNGLGKQSDFFDDEDMAYGRMYAPSPPPFASSKRMSMATHSEGSNGYRDSLSSNRMSTNFDEMLDPRPLLMAEQGTTQSPIKDPLSVRQNQRLRVLVGSGGSVIPSSTTTSSSDEHKPDAASHSPDH